jgi:hypothetical protein
VGHLYYAAYLKRRAKFDLEVLCHTRHYLSWGQEHKARQRGRKGKRTEVTSPRKKQRKRKKKPERKTTSNAPTKRGVLYRVKTCGLQIAKAASRKLEAAPAGW